MSLRVFSVQLNTQKKAPAPSDRKLQSFLFRGGSMEYILYMDESSKGGPFYGNFYGGALVRSIHLDQVIALLENKKRSLNMFKEVKWQRVTPNYLNKYIDLVDTFFYLISSDLVKLRVFFTHNYVQPIGLTTEQKDNEFTLLYYQFLKHSFGLQYSNNSGEPVSLKLYFDILPVPANEKQKFMAYVLGLQNWQEFKSAQILICPENVAEVDSDQHVILQMMDIVLGAIHFRLNDFHKAVDPITGSRGKRTIAKETLYNHINGRIRKIYPNFNIGLATGIKGDPSNHWRHPYRHWRFEPYNNKTDHA